MAVCSIPLFFNDINGRLSNEVKKVVVGIIVADQKIFLIKWPIVRAFVGGAVSC